MILLSARCLLGFFCMHFYNMYIALGQVPPNLALNLGRFQYQLATVDNCLSAVDETNPKIATGIAFSWLSFLQSTSCTDNHWTIILLEILHTQRESCSGLFLQCSGERRVGVYAQMVQTLE